MTTDGGLRQLYQKHLPTFHWQGVETWSTGQGVPDCNFCAEGSEGWIENKVTHTNAIKFQTEQIGWIERRRRPVVGFSSASGKPGTLDPEKGLQETCSIFSQGTLCGRSPWAV
jgi:hypothetical protein